MTEPKVLTYDEWLATTGNAPKMEKCSECGGKGWEWCGECGQQTECRECDGRGKWDATLIEYHGQRERDLARWKEAQATAGAA